MLRFLHTVSAPDPSHDCGRTPRVTATASPGLTHSPDILLVSAPVWLVQADGRAALGSAHQRKVDARVHGPDHLAQDRRTSPYVRYMHVYTTCICVMCMYTLYVYMCAQRNATQDEVGSRPVLHADTACAPPPPPPPTCAARGSLAGQWVPAEARSARRARATCWAEGLAHAWHPYPYASLPLRGLLPVHLTSSRTREAVQPQHVCCPHDRFFAVVLFSFSYSSFHCQLPGIPAKRYSPSRFARLVAPARLPRSRPCSRSSALYTWPPTKTKRDSTRAHGGSGGPSPLCASKASAVH